MELHFGKHRILSILVVNIKPLSRLKKVLQIITFNDITDINISY